MTMGEYIKLLREERGWTQTDLGDRVGVNAAAVNKWEKGRVENIKRPTIAKLAETFGVSPAKLMCFDEPAPVEESYTEEELELIRVYRSLNEEGRSFVEQVKKLLRSSPQYYKEDEEKEKTEG